MKINKIKGTLDYFDEDAKLCRYIEQTFTLNAKRFGFTEMQTPIFEATEVFVRSVGESSDIVTKEMYTFDDRGKRSITLRPEGTAAIMRSYLENKLYVKSGLNKYYYVGPFFRYERPQSGRYRQFLQFGVEAYGVESPYLDADIINLAFSSFKAMGIKNIKLVINTIGSKDTRINYSQVLKEYFADKVETLCDDCKVRLIKNPLRMLDCKVDSDNPSIINAPKISDILSAEDKAYFSKILTLLDEYNIPYEVDDHLVRGLDYYTNDVFEFYYDDPNSNLNKLALGGGGRYNNMAEEFDGPNVPAVGFAIGIDRLVLLMKEQNIIVKDDFIKCAVLTLGEDLKLEGLRLVNYLREMGIMAEIDYVNNNLKAQFKMSERIDAQYILIIGSDEFENNIIKIKDTILKQEITLPISELNKFLNIKENKQYAYKH